MGWSLKMVAGSLLFPIFGVMAMPLLVVVLWVAFGAAEWVIALF